MPQAGDEWPMRYVVIDEPTATGWSAYVPDVPGCIAPGRTREEAHGQIREAIDFRIQGLREAGEPVPPSSSVADVGEVAGG